MHEKNRPDAKPTEPGDDGVAGRHDEAVPKARHKGKPLPDGEAIAELGDEVGGPA
jgi:hypothetical protein